jgi:hypothetical protein
MSEKVGRCLARISQKRVPQAIARTALLSTFAIGPALA